ncbi:MAG: PEP-CTERM sorting domain-containing protein [Planctomycetota bacterium]
MNKLSLQLIFAATVVSAWAASARAAPHSLEDLYRNGDIVVDQEPTRLGGPGADTDFINVLGLRVWQQVADNILLSEPASIRRIAWWGFYGGSGTPATPPPSVETMRIRFYGARVGDGLPDDNNILYEESFFNPSRTATGEIILVGGIPNEYIYEVDLTSPLSLEAGVPYWLEIVQIGDVDTAFRWENGFGVLAGHAFVNGNVPDWRVSPSGSMAFQLSTVPEPATATLMLMGAILIWAQRGGGRRRGVN